MAVDTKDKRLSMLSFGDGTGIRLLPDPDMSIDLNDQQHLLDCYGGIAFAGPPAPAVGSPVARTAISMSIGVGR